MSVDNPSGGAAVDPAAGPVHVANPPESSCEPLPELAAEAAPAADGLPAAVEAEAGSGAESDAVSSGTNPEMKPRGRPFEPGQSGNPAGRPKGSRNRVTRAIEALIDGQGEALGAKALEKALAGDAPMLRVLLSTLLPARRERRVEFDLPKIENAGDAVKASAAVLSACALGDLSPREASEIMALISTHVRTLEVAELETRVVALEKKQAPPEKKVGYERWAELEALRKSRGILTDEDDKESYGLELQDGPVGEKIRAEIARRLAAES